MSKFIEVTSSNTKRKIHINIDMIGHISSFSQHSSYVGEDITNIGCLTHNNGGFNVLETMEEVLKKIKSSQNEK